MKKKSITQAHTEDINTRVAFLWDKFDFDRKSTLDINLAIQEHLFYRNAGDLTEKIPNLLEASESLKAQTEAALLKSPEALFTVSALDSNGQMTPPEYAEVQKQSLLDCLQRGKIIEEYIKGFDNWVDQGECIFYHYWNTEKGKRRTPTALSNDDGTAKLNDDLTPAYEYAMEEYTVYEGAAALSIKPKDFVFDTTKKAQLYTSRCPKIVRSWRTVEDIIYDPLFKDKLTPAQIKELEDSVEGVTPQTEQNFNDPANKQNNRKQLGDMIEVLEYWGDLRLLDGTLFEDYVFTTVARKFVVRAEESPFSKCPFTYLEYFPDYVTNRGLSALVTLIGLNTKATKIWNSILESGQFALNPAWIVRAGGHFLNKKDKIEPGDILQFSDNGAKDLPQPIETFKNMGLTFELITFIEKAIEQASGISKYEAGDATGTARTATEVNQILTGANIRLNRRVMMLATSLVRSVEIIASIESDFSDIGATKNLTYKNSQGAITESTVNEAIRTGVYKYAIGAIQTIMEKKAKVNELAPLIQQFIQLGAKFNVQTLWNIAAAAYDIPHSDQLLELDALDKLLNTLPPEVQQPIKDQLAQVLQQILAQHTQNMQAQTPEGQAAAGGTPNAL